ncbi:enolase C-terminal domain-like protein [Bradyrhizobium genosp. P]|uniref:enolase C-terminal domain-like protein n=1 Tax=Bradyrhizobium genosp. P TaxID=83641 RepID=UPI003CF65EDA
MLDQLIYNTREYLTILGGGWIGSIYVGRSNCPGVEMSWSNDLKIVWKIALIVTLLGAVGFLSMGFAAMRMKVIDEAYSDLVNRVDVATVAVAPGNRNVESYVSLVYQLLLETSAEGSSPDDVRLMVDFNQALTFSDAMRCSLMLDGEGIYWIEEPLRHDDYYHAALIAQAVKTPIQIGENCTGLLPMVAALSAVASDYVMLDLDRISVTGWQRAAGLAAAYHREVSSHLFPEVSAHLLAATPGRHWLEYVDWAVPILQDPIQIVNGMAIVPNRPGNGMRWDEAAVAKFRLD